MKDITYPKVKQGLYAIEPDGRVYSYTKKDYMKTRIDKDGYPSLSLKNWKNGYTNFSIHRLLMVTFKPIANMEDMEVNHIDGNKLNNNFDNLEWCTTKENLNHARAIGLNNSCKRFAATHAKITEEEAIKIIELLNQGYKSPAIIKEIPNANKKIVSKIKTGATWKNLPRPW